MIDTIFTILFFAWMFWGLWLWRKNRIFKKQCPELRYNLNTLKIEIGRELLPLVNQLTEDLKKMMDELGDTK